MDQIVGFTSPKAKMAFGDAAKIYQELIKCLKAESF